jgi:hypothetical protein
MKITVDYSELKKETENLKIVEAKYLSDFVIRISFNDSTEMLVDFKPFLEKSSHPSIRKYLDEKKFSNYKVIDGNLNWNDYDMIFPIWDLYQGKIE